MRTYIFTLKHDKGKVEIEKTAETFEEAKKKVLDDELAPESAIISHREILFKVVKIFRKSYRRQILEKKLSRGDAIRIVNSFPNSSKHIVIFTRH